VFLRYFDFIHGTNNNTKPHKRLGAFLI